MSSMKKKFNVGLLGCGDVSDIYFKTCKNFEILQITACASRHIENARKKALKYGIPKACSIAELIADPELDIIDTTVPEAHAGLTRRRWQRASTCIRRSRWRPTWPAAGRS